MAEAEQQAGRNNKHKRRWWQRLRRTLVWLVLLIILAITLLQTPFLQNWLVDRVTKNLAQTLETEVSVDYVRLSWFNELVIEGLYVEDKYGDTLLYSQRLEASFNLLSLLERSLEIESVAISDTRFQIRRDLGDAESNLETALERLFPPKDEPANPIDLQLRTIELANIDFVQNDSVRGQRFDVSLVNAVVRLNALDLPGKVIDVRTVEVREPLVIQTSIPPTPLPVTPEREAELRLQDSLARDTNQVLLQLTAGSIEVINGAYVLNNFRKDPILEADIEAVDFARLATNDVNLELRDVDFYDGTLRAELHSLNLDEQSGFILDQLSARELLVSPTKLTLNDLVLATPTSRLTDSLTFSFRNGWDSWSDFEEEVRMDIRLEQSDIAIRDLLYFARNLRFNPFFRDNQGETISLGGHIQGRVNNLRADDLNLRIGRNNYLLGQFSSRNLTRFESAALNLRLDEVRTSVTTLRRLLPRFAPPANFDKLGELTFSGSFDGFLTDFAARGKLTTDIGAASMDMSLDLGEGADLATYRGDLILNDFDLGTWTGNEQFGRVSLTAAIRNGTGLRAEVAAADLSGLIREISFRDYTYGNAELSGRLEEKFFDGTFTIADDNIDFSFQGQLDFRDSIPTFDFAADIEKLDLLAVNLSTRPIALTGGIDIELANTDFSDMEGRIDLRDFVVMRDSVTIPVDSLVAYSTFDGQGRKIVKLESDIARGELIGSFDLDEVTGSLTSYLRTFYPGWARRLNLRPPRRELAPNRFSFDLTFVDSKGLNRIVSPKLGPLVDVHLTGEYDGFEHRMRAQLIAPSFAFGNVELRDLILTTRGDGSEGELDFIVDSTLINGQPTLDRVTLLSLITQDTLDFGLTYGGREGSVLLNTVNLNGRVTLPDSQKYAIRFDESDLRLFQEPWSIRQDNFIVFGPGYFDTQNFSLMSGKRRIGLTRLGDRGLELDIENMPLGLLDSVWNYEPLDFSGEFDVHAEVEDVFAQRGITANVRSDTLLINGDDYGYLRMDLQTPDPKGRLTGFMNLNRDTAQLIAEVNYNLGDLVAAPTGNYQRKNYLDLTVDIDGYPLDLARYWVGGSVSDIQGLVNGQLTVEGLGEQTEVGGYIGVTDGAFTLDYLQTRYRFNRSRVLITNDLFDLDGTRLYDRYGNRAVLTGGVTHDRLKDLGLNVTINTNRFLALDLAPGDNPNFFGTALGAGTVRFTGDFRQTDIYVRATVGRGSRLSIPVSEGTERGPIDNVRFVDRSIYVQDELTASSDPTGVSLTMELDITDQAVGEIIFDEEVGDVLRGSGNGNLTLIIPRDGDLQMYGNYNITEGDYLFTFYRVINKEFNVRPGGSVVWTGDPFEAQIDIEADYQNLKTPIANFIQEYLVSGNQNLQNAATQATDVDLTLKLDGILTQPNINFDIGFPNLDGQLESYANNKRRLLLLDQNELNRQVFGLIVVGQFLPSDLSFSVNDVALNTVSEWLSNYLSLLLNDLVADAFGEESFISSLDFDLAYSNFRNAGLDNNQDGRGQAFEFSVRKDFNDRLSGKLNVGYLDNSAIANLANSGRFISDDLVFEYVMNDSRSLILRFYQRYQPDIATGNRLQFGTGLTWRRQFDSFGEFFSEIGRGGTGR